MSNWPVNPYLDSWLRTPEGQAYLEKHGSLEAWKRRHLLDDIPIVADASLLENSFTLVSNRSFVTVTNLALPEPDAWKDKFPLPLNVSNTRIVEGPPQYEVWNPTATIETSAPAPEDPWGF